MAKAAASYPFALSRFRRSVAASIAIRLAKLLKSPCMKSTDSSIQSAPEKVIFACFSDDMLALYKQTLELIR